jgi:polyphosphate kinase 2 (PPK2 family)
MAAGGAVFETAELGRKVPKKEFKRRLPALRESLLLAQVLMREKKVPVLLLFAGVDGAGKGGTANLLNEWLDPRWIITRAYREPSQEERERPPFWRYWRDLPAHGQLAQFLSAWYSDPLLDRVHGRIDDATLDARLDEILAFERMLADGGMVILKMWMHLGRKAQKKRLEALEKDPLQKWRVSATDWKHWRRYDRFVETAERIIVRTNKGRAPWHIVEGADPNYRSLRVGELLLEAVERKLVELQQRRQTASLPRPGPISIVAQPGPHALDEAEVGDEASAAEDLTNGNGDGNGDGNGGVGERLVTVLTPLDLDQSLDKPAFKVALSKHQGQLNLVHRKLRERGVSTILVFEGWDAAGKGGSIRRLVSALDARSVRVHPVAAPTDEERAHHYLWRFWRNLPRAGEVAIFDRSWYGRVLVERVEGFASEAEWRRAYGEINQFERELTQHGTVLIKFWVHISPEEQLDRFKLREETSYKRWKLTEEDWRNRSRWNDYERAVHDMVERTSTREAPWVLVEGNDKRFARVKVLRTVCDAMVDRLSQLEAEG